MDKRIKVIIIDDELNSIEAMQWELKAFKNYIEIVDSCVSPEEGLKAINNNEIDLLFLDIEMPIMNGFELLEKIEIIDFDVVFTTAYDQFALKAFKISAMDYLLKPVRFQDLEKVIEKAKNKKEEPAIQKQLELLFQYMKSKNPDFPTIALPTMEGLEFIEISKITNCESDSNYCHIYTSDGENFLISKTLKEIEVLLTGHNFVRVHNSHLVNLLHAKRYNKGRGGELILKNKKSIPVSRSKKDDLLKLF